MQDEKYIRARITELRIKKNVSEYRMSLDLGHSDSYIRAITSGRALPSMSEFFDEKTDNPILLGRLCEAAKGLSDEDMTALLTMAERLGKNNKSKKKSRDERDFSYSFTPLRHRNRGHRVYRQPFLRNRHSRLS